MLIIHLRWLTRLLVLLICSGSIAAQETDQPQDLKKLSIEELTQVQVTSVSRRAERVTQTAAAVSLIRNEDIVRSGATTFAEALRLGTATDVAQVNGNTWGISTRGFNISTANKLLVLIDGRSTYVPLFGGTFWDVQDAVLTDVDRIEVIRGPGGTIWGGNAVNGVVNVISRPAAETHGTSLTLIGGTNERAVASARYGARLGAGSFRVYGKYRHRGPQLFLTGGSAGDEVDQAQAGFRYDSDATPDTQTRWTLSGLAYHGTIGFFDRDNGETAGGHLLGRLTRLTRRGEFGVQAYFDRASRFIPLQFDSGRNTWEVDAQQAVRTGRHNLVFGSTLRVADARDTGLLGFVLEPERRTSWIVNAFAQDEFQVRPDLYVTAGAKIGRNNYTGFELQPNVRLRVNRGDRQIAWAAVSRAVRLPTRFDTDLRILNPVTQRVTITGSDDFNAESVVAYEAGYRVMPNRRLSIDAAVFTNRYNSLRSQERQPSGVTVLANLMNARTSGIELATAVQAASFWRIHGNYAWLRKSISFDPGSLDVTGGASEGNDPSHLFGLRSFVDLPAGTAIDAMFRYVGRRPAPAIPAYAELDLRLGWMVRPGWELSLIGQNLLHRAHQELSAGPRGEQFRRAVFARSIWRF